MSGGSEFPQAVEKELNKLDQCINTAYSQSLDSIDSLILLLEGSKFDANLANAVVKEVTETKTKCAKDFKTLYTGVIKYGQTIEKEMISNLEAVFTSPSKTSSSTAKGFFDEDSLNQVILDDFFREGRFELAENFRAECRGMLVAQGPALMEMHKLRESLEKKEITPCLNWVTDKLTQMRAGSEHDMLMALKFDLHQLQYLAILRPLVSFSSCATTSEQGEEQKRKTKEAQLSALEYARVNFPPFFHMKAKEIDRLTGCLIYLDSLSNSPYKDLFSEDAFTDVVEVFSKLYLTMLNMPSVNPVLTSLMASKVALPKMLKWCAFVEDNKENATLLDDDEMMLPLDVELDKSFQYHSTFVCPISKDQTTQVNPPILLRCGHVISKVAMMKITRQNGGREKRFKCPTCPTEQSPKETLPLQF
mmetsp:Transcript_30807/g.60112  ORF Transcript_30807/g.60112 Transcript_30807/m.60112 type:complete len:419 (-) Transcript_30807:211-1467(-)|eukprot:CAMPEP_0175091906 /NCGR_PEP_ID=MMETSP0086_2-20121207/2169_1 /TAXON_ID=136419 /ORGANISM="Unknown Unknown, Strain D1" /LENGTH=418 /DNA_ID=CAMNT_0016364713 /DNA_START=47 /DNA_END=1303 /DNA_ORIENTATION=-